MSNLDRALEEFNTYVLELEVMEPDTSRKEEIRQKAITCSDLMNYSHLVVDTTSKKWVKLEELVHKVFIYTN